MNQETDLLTTNRKALTLNLDVAKYGTFAEIGAGQEVSRLFFQAGGAAGTIAKSMSAYDMTFSDEIYGKAPRYVSRERLVTMLDHEFELLHERLSDQRGDRTTFFAFADTVAAKSYRGNNECHGWMGVTFQPEPGVAPSLHNLYAHLMENHYIDCINGFNPDILDIFSRDVLQRIKSNDESWESMVPEPVVAAIKSRGLFGYENSDLV